MNRQKAKIAKRVRRHRRVRAKVTGTAKRPRLAVFRANQHIYAQLIDDSTGKTLAAASSVKVTGAKGEKTGAKNTDKDSTMNKTEIAAKVGEAIAKAAIGMKISEIVFDRGGFAYHGRVKALADAARASGLKF